MKSKKIGSNISEVEIVDVSPRGVWLHAKGKEYSLPYKDFPWFKNASLSKIRQVKLFHGHHLRWEKLDIDLELDSLNNLKKYNLKYSNS